MRLGQIVFTYSYFHFAATNRSPWPVISSCVTAIGLRNDSATPRGPTSAPHADERMPAVAFKNFQIPGTPVLGPRHPARRLPGVAPATGTVPLRRCGRSRTLQVASLLGANVFLLASSWTAAIF